MTAPREQLELFRQRREQERLAQMERTLATLGAWVKGNALQVYLGLNERKIRQLAELSDGRIITGNKGYKLIGNATIEEIGECTGRLKSQARQMLRRAIRIERRFHKRNTQP